MKHKRIENFVLNTEIPVLNYLIVIVIVLVIVIAMVIIVVVVAMVMCTKAATGTHWTIKSDR